MPKPFGALVVALVVLFGSPVLQAQEASTVKFYNGAKVVTLDSRSDLVVRFGDECRRQIAAVTDFWKRIDGGNVAHEVMRRDFAVEITLSPPAIFSVPLVKGEVRADRVLIPLEGNRTGPTSHDVFVSFEGKYNSLIFSSTRSLDTLRELAREAGAEKKAATPGFKTSDEGGQ